MKTFTSLLKLAPALLVAALATPVFAQGNLANPAALKETAPEVYKARFETSKGVFVIEARREWAPAGADRFYNLVKNGFFDNARFFRVVTGFMVQFGINGDPAIQKSWRTAGIKDDPVRASNKRGNVTFATAGPNTRTTQVFINFKDNESLNAQGFAPFGQVISGMNIVDGLHAGYGEGAPNGEALALVSLWAASDRGDAPRLGTDWQ